MRVYRISALAGLLQPIWLLGLAVVFGALRPSYDASHAISELGEKGSINAVLWNLVGFGGSGVLHALYAITIGATFGRGWLFRLTILQALSLAASGAFGCDPGCPPTMSSWQGWAHVVVGFAYFTATCTAPLVAWRTFRRSAEFRSVAPLSLAAGIVLVALFVAAPFLFGPELVGIGQRVTLATAGVWAALIAIRLSRVIVGDTASRRHGPLLAGAPPR